VVIVIKLGGKHDELGTGLGPIPGSHKLVRLDENIGSVAIALTADDLGEIDMAMSQITIVGDRY